MPLPTLIWKARGCVSSRVALKPFNHEEEIPGIGLNTKKKDRILEPLPGQTRDRTKMRVTFSDSAWNSARRRLAGFFTIVGHLRHIARGAVQLKYVFT